MSKEERMIVLFTILVREKEGYSHRQQERGKNLSSPSPLA